MSADAHFAAATAVWSSCVRRQGDVTSSRRRGDERGALLHASRVD